MSLKEDTLRSILALPASWAEFEGSNGGPQNFGFFTIKIRNLAWGPKFDTDSRGLKPKPMGLHLKSVRGDTLGSTLALPASWAEVEGSNGGPQNFYFYAIKIRNVARGPNFDTDSRGLKPKATRLQLAGLKRDTLVSTLALPASWTEVEGSNTGPKNFGFYSIEIRNLARVSQVRHGFSGL